MEQDRRAKRTQTSVCHSSVLIRSTQWCPERTGLSARMDADRMDSECVQGGMNRAVTGQFAQAQSDAVPVCTLSCSQLNSHSTICSLVCSSFSLSLSVLSLFPSHDKCYDRCGVTRSSCDSNFQRCMSSQCSVFSQRGSRGRKEFDDCSEQARTFNTAARLLGCEAFQGSQREACECTFIQSAKAKLAEGKDAVEGVE